MLAGEAGIGKTWIAREVARQAAGRGAIVLWGSSLEGDWQPPYGPWVEALGEYVRSSEAEGLGRALGPGAAALAQIVPEIRVILPDTAPAPPLSPSEERLRLYEGVTQFLLAIATRSPVLLVLDDLHWADRDSLGLLHSLARFVPRSHLMVVGAYRDVEVEPSRGHPLTELLANLHRQDAYHHILLRGLAQDEVAEYLAHWAGQALPVGLVESIYAQTDGNPFYVREVFRHLLEERKILQRSGRWSTDFSLGELGIPEGVRRVVERRVACLSEETGRMLRLAAAFRGTFGFRSLQALMELPEEVLLGCLDEALAAGLVSVVDLEPPMYDFAHAIVRQTLYDRLNPDRRARLHRRIARALREVYAGHESRHAAEIAVQYHASIGLPGEGEGVPYALAAAEQASAGYAHERAVTFLRMGRDLSAESEAGVRADVLCKLAVAEAEALQLMEGRETAEEALAAMLEAGAEPVERAAFLALVGRALKDGGAEPSLWEPLVERGISLCGERRDLAWARLTLLCDSLEPVSGGGIGAARWLGHDALAVSIARASGDEDDYARTLDALESRTPEETSRVLTLARTWERPTAIMRVLDMVGRDLLKRGETYREAVELYQELLATSERCGSIAGQGEALLQLAVTQAQLGELSLAQQMGRRAHEMIARLGPAHELRFQERGLAVTLAYFLDADWSAMAAGASQFVTALGETQNPRAHLAAACAALAQGRTGSGTEAHGLLEVLTPVIACIEPTIYVHQATVLFASTAVWDVGAAEFAPTYLRLARDIIEAGFGRNMLVHELTVARMTALLGDIVEASNCFGHAREVLDAGGLRTSRAIADYDEALALVRAGSADREHILALLDAALASFHSLGMTGWAKRALDLKGKLAPPPVLSVESPHSNGLTPRELDVLRLLASGKTNREIAEALVLSPRTVEQHIAHLYGKIGARGRADATSHALRHGLVEPDER